MFRGAGTTCVSFLSRLSAPDDQLSWREFHKRYGIPLYRYARRNGVAHNDAEDIVQELEMSFFRAVDGFRYDRRRGRFRGYLLTSISRIIRRFRARGRIREAVIDPVDLTEFVVAACDDAAQTDDARLSRLRETMASVQAEFHPTTLEAFRRYAIAGESAAETARLLGMDVASVYQAKSRVLKRIREQLNTEPT